MTLSGLSNLLFCYGWFHEQKWELVLGEGGRQEWGVKIKTFYDHARTICSEFLLQLKFTNLENLHYIVFRLYIYYLQECYTCTCSCYKICHFTTYIFRNLLHSDIFILAQYKCIWIYFYLEGEGTHFFLTWNTK